MLDYELPIPDQPSHHQLDGSKLNRFMECPRAFFYEYLLGWRNEKPNNHLVFGTAWHDAMEYLLLHGVSQHSVLEAFKKFEHSYRSTFQNPELDEMFFPKTPDRAFSALAEYALKYENDLLKYEVLFTEISFTVAMDETRSLIGRMDSIVRHRKSGKIRSLEHKTASNFWNWEKQWPLAMQTGVYTHALYCLYNLDEVEGIIFNGVAFLKAKGTRGGKLFDFLRVPAYRSKSQMQTWYQNTLYWMDAVENEYRILAEATESDDVLQAFPQNTTNCSKWFGCAYKDFCNAWANPLKHCSQPPLGMIEEHWCPHDEPSTVNMTLGNGAEPQITEGEKKCKMSQIKQNYIMDQ